MALSADSSWPRWQWRISSGNCQAPSETTPLLASHRTRQSSSTRKQRLVFPNNQAFHRAWEETSKNYPGNRIRTTKYTLLTFLPQNLLEQFHRWANVYFLFLVILNWVPSLEVFHREITMMPLVLVLLIIMVKDGLEDFRRHCFDREINYTSIWVHSKKEQSYVRKRWEDVRVGDFVRLQCNEIVPADILLLCSSDPSGLCHLETSNLDGETNLKQRRAVGHGTWQVRREEASVGNNHEGDAEGRDRVFEGLREETRPSPGKEAAAELRNAAPGDGERGRHIP